MQPSDQDAGPACDRPFAVPDYFAFVDESGTGSFKGCHLDAERFLCLTCLLFPSGYYHERVVPYIEWLKHSVFGDTNLVLHRNSIIWGRIKNQGPFSVLNDDAKRSMFESALSRFYRDAHYNVCSVLIDKRAMLDEYPTWIPDVYEIAMENLVERICLWFRCRHITCKIIFEARGEREDRWLQREYSKIHADGTRYIPGRTIRSVISSRWIDFHKKKENIIGLQLSDLIGTDAKRRILRDHYGTTTRGGFGAMLVNSLYDGNRYFADPETLEVRGYGVVIRPKK